MRRPRAPVLALDMRLQARQCVVPLSGNPIEINPRTSASGCRFEGEQAFAADAEVVHHPGVFEDAEVLGDRLPRQA